MNSTKSTFKILIVDDEPKNIQLLGNLLTENKYEVEFATSGEEALKWVDRTPFDLVLLDIMMPGMDGYQVCEKIKTDKLKAHIPVIFLTAKTESDSIVRGFEVGGADYVTKPFNSSELLARVKMHVEMKILRGLIPICANCKDIRDDKGTWNQMEAYIQKHSPVLFSHGMCPKCMEDLYGDQEWYQQKFGKSGKP